MATKSRLISKLISGTGQIKAAVLDSDAIGVSTQKSLSTVSGTATYSSADTLPTSASDGDQALVTSTNKLYVYSGSGWYNIALVNNTPYWSTEASSSYDLNINGTSTTITILAVDSEGIPIIYTAVTDSDFNQIATVTKDSDNGRVFIVTPTDSENGAAPVSGTGTITFKASDGVNLVSTLSTFNLTFITSIDSSNYTRLLTKADSSSTDNQVDASANSHTITESGSVISTAFSPYHPGGYSYYFDGSGDYLTTPTSSDFTYGTGDFTIEAWVYIPSAPSNYKYILGQATVSTGLGLYIQSGVYKLYGGGGLIVQSSTGYQLNKWEHIAISRSGTTLKMFLNGAEVGSVTNSLNFASGTSNGLTIGRWLEAPDTQSWLGYIKDVRVVKGTAVYTSAFTPTTVPLTAIANTKLLLGNLPYNEDASTSSHPITPSITGVGPGSTMMARFSPYDYDTYTKTDHGGSLDFQAASAYMAVDSGAITSSWGNNFTVEFWLHRDTLYDGTIFDNRIGAQYPGFFINVQSNGVAVYAQGWLQTSIGAGNTGGDYLGKWAHYALTFSGTEGKSFVNGKLSHTYTIPDTATYSYNKAQNTIGAKQYTTRGDESLGQYKARLADFRISKVLRYTTDFTPPTTAFVSDTDTLLLTCTNKNPIWDASTGKEWIQKGSGTVTVSNTQRKFTTSSAIQFTNGSGNYLYADLGETIGTRDFTIEAWVYTTSTTGQYAVQISNVAGVGYQAITSTNTQVGFGIQSGIWRHLSTGGWPLTGYVHTGVSATINTWHHVAQVRTGGSSKLYLNGTLISTNADTNNYSARYVAYGAGHNGYIWAGYTQDLRITLDHARYTSNFTPPTAEFDG